MSKYITSNLYATLRDNGINMPTEEVFYKNMSDPNYRKTLHKGLQDKGFDLDDIREFQVHWHNKFANDPNYKEKDEVTSKPVAQQPKQQSQPTQQSSQRMLSGQRVPKQQHIERVETTSKPTTDEDLAKTFVMSPEWQEQYAIDQETKAEDAKDKQIADNYNAMSKLEDTFAAYEQSQDVPDLFNVGQQEPIFGEDPKKYWRNRVAKRKEGEAQAKAKVDQEREELRQRMQLLKDNPDAYNELYGFKGFDIDTKVNLDNLFTFDPTVDKRGNKHDNIFSKAFANQRIDAENKALQLGFQQQELQDMLADPMALEKTMREVEAEIERLGKARDAAAQKFSSENPFKAILFSTKGTKSLDPWLEGAYGPEAQAITLELEKAFAKLDNLKNIEKKIKSGELPRGGFWNGVGQMGQAVADKVTDRSWGMYEGMSNMLSESEKQIVFDKIAKGEPLTASEMQWATIDLLEGKVNTEVDSPYLYNITSGLMESAPYMRDILLSPGKGISGAFVNWGKSRYGATGFLKLVGNALQGAATTATVGADELVSGTSERMRGDLSFGENGLEVTGQKSLGRALTQQFASQTASNMVELMGVPLLDKAGKYIGKAVKEVADGLSYGKVSKVLSAMDKSSAVNWVNGVRKSMGIHSLPAEIGEEYVDAFAQSIVEGEDQLSPMLNTEEFLNIAGTCGLMSAIFGSANVAGFAGEFHKVNREFKKAKQEVLRQFSSDVWASLDNLITNAQDEDLTVRLADAMDGMAMNREQRSAIMNYLTALKRYQKFNELNDGGKFIIGGPQAQATQSTSTSTYEIDSDITLKDEIGNPIDAHIVGRDANGNYMVESSQPINGKRVQPLSADQLDAMVIPNTPDGIQQSEVDGYNLTDANQQAEVSMLTDNARESVATLLGVTPDAVDVTLQQVLGDNPTDAKIDARFGDNAQVVKDYMYNVAKTKGMSARLIDDIADATAESDRAIDAVVNNGNVVTAMLGEEKVNITSGEVVTFDDGVVDKANSSKSVTIKHADSTTEMVAPTSLTEVVSMPTEQAKATQAQAIAQQMQQAFSDKLNGALDYSQGQQYTMLNTDGSTTDVTILADNGDGNVTVTARDGNKEGGVTDGKQIVLPKSQIQQGVREFKRNQLRGESAQQASIPQAESQPTKVAEPKQESTTPTDEQGNVAYEDMDADSAWDRLVAESGDDVDIATMVAQSNIEDAQKALDKAKKQTPKLVGTTEEKLATAKAFKESVVKAQNDLAKWQEIADVPKRRASLQTEQTESQTDLQTEQAEQTESQGQQVTGKLPASEEVGPTEITPVEEVAQIEESAPIEEQTMGNGSTMSQETDQVEEENRLAEQSIDSLIDAARNGDKNAIEQLDAYGIDWRTSTVYRYVSSREVDALQNGETILGKHGNGRVDVTSSTEPSTGADAEFRITFNDNFDFGKSKNVKMKNKDLGDGWTDRGYSLEDVAVIERRNDDGTYSVVYSSSLSTSQTNKTVNEEKAKKEADKKAKQLAKTFAGTYQQLGEPMTFEEFVLRELSSGKIKFIWGDNTNNTKGLSSHLGYHSEAERKQRLWMLDNQRGERPEVVAQGLLEDARAQYNLGHNIDDMDALNVLLDIVATYPTARSMFDEVVAMHKRAGEAEERYYQELEEQDIYNTYHMSIEEYRDYCDVVEEEIKQKHLSDKEHDEYNNIYIESALNEQKAINNEDNQRNDQRRTDGIRTSGNGVLQEEQSDSPRGNRDIGEDGRSEADDNGNSENAVASEGEQVGYSITPATYVTKANKVLDMHLLVFDRPLGKEEHKSAREIAKSLRGWYDAKEGGYMMRSEEDAKSLANAMLDKEVVESTQPVSLVDSNDYVANIRSILDKYDDVISDITKEITNDSALMGALKDTDSVQSIALIDQAVGEHVSKNFSTLSEIGFVSAWNKHRFTINEAVDLKVWQIRRKREYEELRAKGVNGFKIGDKVMYKGAVATIHDFEDYGDNNPVLDTGMAPVIYEVSEWSDVSKIDEDTPEAKLAKIKAENPNAVIIEDPSTWVGKTFFANGMRLKCTDVGGGYASFDNLDTYMGMGYDISVVQNFLRKGEWAHVEEKKSSEKSPSKPKESKLTKSKVKNPSGNKLVTDERYAELRERMRKKLGGQMNMGIDPEILAIGTEMAVYHIEKGARKFKDYATDMIADLGDAIRPYLKAFYNGARELPEVEDAGFVNDMTPYEEVKSFDVANFDKVVPNPLDTADAIAKEAEVEKQAEEANEKIKDARNDKRVEFINNLHSGDRVILKDGRNVLISIVMHRGEQVLVNNAFGYTKPTAERFYATYKGELIDFTPDKIDVDATLKFREDLTSKTSESTEKSVPLQDNKLHREFVKAVTTDMLSALDTNERPYRSIVDIRKRAKEVGIEVDNEGRDDILLQELVEDGLVRAARLVNISWGGAKYSRRSFDEICQLYAMQPTIAQRSSNRIKMQQYSTPLPMAWVANHFAMHGKKDGKVLEPTAGNGMLVFSIPPKQVHVNELDETRLANLREQGFAEVTQQDATEPFEGGKQYDVILANPPFGKRDAVEFDGDKISGLDPQITLNALDAMKDNGRAAIIIGGNFEYRPNGAIKDKPAFWSHLYNHYNVVGVVDMSGDMYARQGTTFPTRMILINGRRSEEDRKQGTCYPPVQADAVRKAETFDDLYEIVNELIEFNLNNKTNGTIISSEGLSSKPVSDKPQGKTGQVGHRRQSKKGDSSIEQVQRGLDSGTENPLVAVLGNDNANGEQSRPDKREDDRSGNQGNDVRVELEGGNATEGSGVRTRTDSADGGRHGGTGGQGLVDSVNDNTGTSSVRSTDVLVERKLDTEKLPYRPHNTAFSLESVAPAHMVEAMDAVLSDIESQYGNIDQFVTDELGYNSVDEMHNALAAEQVDSVAMAIYQMKQGKAMIIGDQTGVGKGRQMASLIRWAVKQGKTPIFATQKADLFSDIYRDLVDIGSGDLMPFIFNARTGKNKGEMVDANGEVVHRGLPDAKMKEVLKAGVLPEGYDFVVLTYSQVNNGPEHPKAKLLANIAKDNYLFLDESHTAAGESKTGECFQKAVASAKAVTFASATYAKRPDTMPLYALRTSMNEANVGMDELIDIIKRGGVTLQEIMSRELTNAGQMVRRERDMSDVVTDWVIVDDANTSQVARDNYDRTINAFNAIIKFQEDYVNPTLKGESEKVAREMKSISKTAGTNKIGIDNTPFASHTFNYTKQLMLALKVDAIIDYVDREIKAGRHPVIALENTMESSYKDFNDGEELDDTSFSRGLLKGLDSTLKFTIKNNGVQKPGILYPSQLIGDGKAKYYELQKFIYESTKDIFISPLDAIIDGLHRKGYRVGELTGRSKVVSIEGDKAVVRNRKDTDKKKLQREFNSGLLDVLILNKSAATGISLHASERFSDQRQRTMILVQPLSDINDYMQMIGRIDRTGQVHRGYYINLGLPIPAENRFLMMLSTKLKSLNANTTTSQDSESNEVKAPDLLNKYGGQVIIEYLRDNPDVYVKIGEPLSGVSVDDLETYTANDETASKITGRVALLTIKEQEDFYDDVIRRYNDLINYLNDTGTNDLKINVVPLRAETIAKRVTSSGKDPNGNNPFAQDAYLEKVEMDVIRKPMKSAEVQKTIEKVNDGLSHDAHLNKIAEIVTAETSAKVDKEVERHSKATERVNAEIESHTKKVNKMDKLSEEEKQKVIEDYANTKIADIADKHSANLSKLRDAQKVYFDNLKLFTTGDTYLIPDNLETLTYSTLSPAIFCGYKTKDSKITASTTFAVFAVLDGRRKIEIKLSEMSKLKSIYYATMQNIGTAKSTNLTNWDSQMPNETRREGYILTGNILQAVADTMDENGNYTGQLVSYTDIDGNVRDGVLMPDNWNPKLLKSGKAPIISKLTQIKNGERVESSDGDVVIAKNRWGYTYTLSVPKTKKRGGKFFEDTELLNLVSNGVFYPNRGRLQADVISERIDRVVQRLTELDVKVEAEKSEDDAMFRASEEIEAEYRQGEGAYTDAEVSFANDLVSRAWGENLRSKKQQQSFANRIRKQMRQHAQSLAETLRVPIEILDNPNGLTGKKARAKGFYDKKTEKATVILSNNNSLEDIEATVLHELVGHYGLRELFGENFDRFLYNVYTHAEADVKERINRLARKNNWDFAKATEEYLASLAEDESIYRNSQDQTRWLFRIKRFFMEMLRTLGFNYLGPSLSDNELKYVLWCSYQNLQGELNPIFKTASDVAMQSALKVGQFEEQTPKRALASEGGEFDNEPDVLLRDTEDSVARDMYERKLASTAYQSTEAFQDSMLGLKVFQDAVLEANGKGKEAIADFENAYMAENALSSKNYAQTEEFKNRLFIPLVTEMASLEPSGEYGNLYDYMMAKHGLERNRVMAERDAEAFFENYEGEDTFEEILAKFRKNDYSGLTSLTGEEDVESAEEIAYQMVEDYENSHNTSALWDKINACTADILKKQFEGGLISRDTYNQISAMYENYIPLRGWKETTADDVYTYLTSKSGAFNAPIRTARGRSSVADNPIATIAHMAESGIAQANRNKLKQQFYNFCLNNPSNLASISDVWLQYNPVAEEWEVVSPQIDKDATAEEVEQIMSDFNERMKSLAEENPDEYKKGSQAKGIPYKIGKGVLSEHQVLVKVNGKDIIITINGNPRAAQAVNGLTNTDSEMSGAIGNLLKLTNYVNRQLSAFYTTRNPEFVVSNFFRDAIYANSMVWVKESPNYAVKFNSNFGKVNPAKMHQLIRKYRNGSLDMSNEIEKAFYDFMINGGETGYTQMRDLEAHKKELDKALKYSQGKMPVRKAWNMFFDRCDEINRAVENCARFAAFVTSRQMGRTIQRSVYDAKEISVNFNKKGAGDKFLKSNNATAKWASLISGAGRIFYVFWNAGIQGMANFAKVSKNNPKGAIVACAAMFVSGALVAMLGYDDEERDYYNLPEYVRRSNLCFKVGNSWVTIPLPIEYRAIYGLGELCASVINGGDKYTPKETAEKVAQQFSQLLPLDMLEGGGGWNPLIPTFAKPWAEAYVFNTDWTGLPIYKENTFNELYPEFTKAYKNANDILVGTSEYLNDVSDGNAYKKGEIDFNPAKLEYVLEGYFGGLATTFNKMVKMGETTFGDREFEWRNMLIASRLVKEGDERQEAKRVQNQYYNYKQEAEETSNQVRGFRGEKRKGILDNADELDFLHHSPEYLRYTIFNEYDDDITALNKKIKEMPDGKEKDNLVIELDALRKELVDQLDATRDLTKEEVKQITTTDPNVNYYRAKEEDADYKEVEIDPLDERFKNATTEEQAEIQKEIDDKMETEGFNHWSNVHDALNAISNTKRAIKSGEAPKNYNDTIHNIKKEIADMRRSYFGNNGLKNKEEGEQ